jgi:hypothetical protein
LLPTVQSRRPQDPPVTSCPKANNRPGYPLRFTSITEVSTLLRGTPPLCPASVLNRLRYFLLRVSLNIGTTGSHVPHKSLIRLLAAFMPEAARAVSRSPPDCSRSRNPTPVLTSSKELSTRHQRFACAQLERIAPDPLYRAFSHLLTTTPLKRSSGERFDASVCTAAPRGLPSSPVQHSCRKVTSYQYPSAPSWRTVPGSAR